MTGAVWRMGILDGAEKVVSTLGCRCSDTDIETHCAEKGRQTTDLDSRLEAMHETQRGKCTEQTKFE